MSQVSERDGARPRTASNPIDDPHTVTDEASAEILLSRADLRIRDSVREVVRRAVAPLAAEVDQSATFPHDQLQALAAAELAGLLMPASVGGQGASTMAYATAMEEISAACGSTATVYMTQMHCAHPIYLAGTDEQRERLIPDLCRCRRYGSLAVTEPDAGSDVASMRTTATRDGDHYVVNGSKTFITSGDRARVIVLFATVDPAAGRDGITAFIVEGDPEGLVRGTPMKKLGLRGSSTCELFFENCRIPATDRLGAEGDGFALSMEAVVNSRISAAAQGVGYAVGAYRSALRWSLARGLLAAGRRDTQQIEFRLADMRSEIAAARTLLLSAAMVVDRHAPGTISDVSIAKLRCTELGVRIPAMALELLGADGDRLQWGIERRLRDAKIAEIYDGTNQIQRMLIARDNRRRAQRAPDTEPETT